MGKVIDVPHSFIAGAAVTPDNLNSNLEHLSQQIRDVQAHRYVYSIVSLPFHESASTPYDQDTHIEVRTYRLPDDITTISGASLRYYGTGDNTVYVYLLDENDGYLPSEAEPFLQVTPTASAGTHTATQLSQIDLEDGVSYRLVMMGDGNWESQNSWVDLRIRSDRYEDGEPTPYNMDLYNSGEILTADSLDSELANVDAAVSSVTNASTNPKRYSVFINHDVSTSTSEDRTTVALPRVDSDDERQQITGLYGFATRGNNSLVTTVVPRWRILDETDSAIVNESVSIGAVNTGSLTWTGTADLDASSVSPTTIGDDYSLVSDVSGPDTLAKLYLWIIYQ